MESDGDYMKKFILNVIFAFIIVAGHNLSAYCAVTLEVQALTPFNSLKPEKTMKVVAMQDMEFENGIIFKNGTIIEGDIIDVKQPKRAKLNASFKFQPTIYTYNGRTNKILDSEFIAKYKEKKPLNKGEIAVSAATTAGEFFLNIPFLSQGVSLVKGFVKNPENNRLKSSVVQVYKDSPLSYVEEGKDIVINKEDIFYLKFKSSDAEDLDAPETEIAPVEQNEKPAAGNDAPKPPVVQVKSVSENISNEESQQLPKVKNLVAPHPDEVLKEVELNSK